MTDNLDIDTVRKVATLESDIRHLTISVEKLAEKVETLNGLLQQAKGARWVFLSMVAGAGLIGASVAKWFTFIPVIR